MTCGLDLFPIHLDASVVTALVVELDDVNGRLVAVGRGTDHVNSLHVFLQSFVAEKVGSESVSVSLKKVTFEIIHFGHESTLYVK